MSIQTYLITGASKGIGFSLVKKLAKNDHTIFAVVRNDEDAFTLMTEVESETLVPIVCDLSAENAEYIISTTLQEYNPQIDCIINNAGIGGKGAQLEVTNTKQILEGFVNNTISAIQVAKAAIPYLAQSQRPLVINMISRFALAEYLEYTTHNVSYSYALSKSALHTCTLLFSKDKTLQNAIALSVDPGPTKTRMGREDAIHAPDFVAEKLYLLTQMQLENFNGKAVNLNEIT